MKTALKKRITVAFFSIEPDLVRFSLLAVCIIFAAAFSMRYAVYSLQKNVPSAVFSIQLESTDAALLPGAEKHTQVSLDGFFAPVKPRTMKVTAVIPVQEKITILTGYYISGFISTGTARKVFITDNSGNSFYTSSGRELNEYTIAEIHTDKAILLKTADLKTGAGTNPIQSALNDIRIEKFIILTAKASSVKDAAQKEESDYRAD